MQESVLSSRRSPPDPEEVEENGDESKTRKNTTPFATRVSKHASAALSGQCAAVLIFLLILLATAASFLISRPVVCVSPYDSLARTALFGATLDGLASDFGSLGVPWCKPSRSFSHAVVLWDFGGFGFLMVASDINKSDKIFDCSESEEWLGFSKILESYLPL